MKTRIANYYIPEVDLIPKLKDQTQNNYQGLIRVLVHWICKLRKLVDIVVMSVSLMSRYLASARWEHLNQLFLLYLCLKQYNRSKLIFNVKLPGVINDRFMECNWTKFYPGSNNVISLDILEALCISQTMECFVNADHAGFKVTRQSHVAVITVLIVYQSFGSPRGRQLWKHQHLIYR